MPEYSDARYKTGGFEAYMKDLREIDKEVSEYASALVKDRFVRQNLDEPQRLQTHLGWEHFAFTFGMTIEGYFLPEQPAEWVRQLMRDLWQFCECNESGSPGNRFALLIQRLNRSKVRQCGLPADVERCFAMIDDWTEAQRERESQQGY